MLEMNYPAASCGVSQQTDVERNCRVGGGAQRRYPPLGMMGIAESILSKAEGLNPSYACIAAQQAAGNRPQVD